MCSKIIYLCNSVTNSFKAQIAEHDRSGIKCKIKSNQIFWSLIAQVGNPKWQERLNNLNTEVSRNDISNLSTTDDYKLRRSKIEHTRLISEAKSFCWNTCFFKIVTHNNTTLLIKRKEKKRKEKKRKEKRKRFWQGWSQDWQILFCSRPKRIWI